jgi:hypothetical protein
MALNETLSQLTGSSVAPKNRVDILLEKWEGTEDGEALLAALNNEEITSATLTLAIRRETKTHSVVTDSSVAAWRRRNASREVNGL